MDRAAHASPRMICIMAALLAFAATASARPILDTPDDRAEVTWRCWYGEERGPALVCRLLRAPGLGEPEPFGPLPPMLQRIRNRPETLRDQLVLIPLFGPPVDMSRAERLARAVMCGSLITCSVEFVPGRI